MAALFHRDEGTVPRSTRRPASSSGRSRPRCPFPCTRAMPFPVSRATPSSSTSAATTGRAHGVDVNSGQWVGVDGHGPVTLAHRRRLAGVRQIAPSRRASSSRQCGDRRLLWEQRSSPELTTRSRRCAGDTIVVWGHGGPIPPSPSADRQPVDVTTAWEAPDLPAA